MMYISFSGLSQNSILNSNTKMQKPFKGFLGISFGTSFIGMKNLRNWTNDISNGSGIRKNLFYNLSFEGFRVMKHFVYGVSLSREIQFITSGPDMTLGSTDVAIYLGASLKDAYNSTQILTTIGIGYSELNVNPHGYALNPSANHSNISSAANLWQFAFWMNPKVTLIKRIGILKVGLEASLGIYIPPASYQYGYYVSQSGTKGTRNQKFVGYTLTDVPNINNISLSIGGFIGF